MLRTALKHYLSDSKSNRVRALLRSGLGVPYSIESTSTLWQLVFLVPDYGIGSLWITPGRTWMDLSDTVASSDRSRGTHMRGVRDEVRRAGGGPPLGSTHGA